MHGRTDFEKNKQIIFLIHVLVGWVTGNVTSCDRKGRKKQNPRMRENNQAGKSSASYDTVTDRRLI